MSLLVNLADFAGARWDYRVNDRAIVVTNKVDPASSSVIPRSDPSYSSWGTLFDLNRIQAQYGMKKIDYQYQAGRSPAPLIRYATQGQPVEAAFSNAPDAAAPVLKTWIA